MPLVVLDDHPADREQRDERAKDDRMPASKGLDRSSSAPVP